VVDREVLVVLLYHVVGLAVSWAYGLIRIDNHRLPARLVGFGMGATTLPMLAYPSLMVVPWQMQVEDSWQPDGLYVDALVRIITALAAATVLARYLARGLCPAADPKLDPLGRSTARLIDLIAILAVPAILVGWQALLAVTVLASLIAIGLRRALPASCDALGRFAIAMPMTLTIQLVFWTQLRPPGDSSSDGGRCWFWPSDASTPWVLLGWTAVVALVPLWLREQGPMRVELIAGSDGHDEDQWPPEEDDSEAETRSSD
jgi:leader peptidase (prepilin peptidase)/N-methyltransferase